MEKICGIIIILGLIALIPMLAYVAYVIKMEIEDKRKTRYADGYQKGLKDGEQLTREKYLSHEKEANDEEEMKVDKSLQVRYSPRFYVRTDDFLVEDTKLNGMTDYRYLFAGPFRRLSDAIEVSQLLRKQHHLSAYNYSERINYLRRLHPNYPQLNNLVE